MFVVYRTIFGLVIVKKLYVGDNVRTLAPQYAEFPWLSEMTSENVASWVVAANPIKNAMSVILLSTIELIVQSCFTSKTKLKLVSQFNPVAGLTNGIVAVVVIVYAPTFVSCEANVKSRVA